MYTVNCTYNPYTQRTYIGTASARVSSLLKRTEAFWLSEEGDKLLLAVILRLT